MIYMTADLHLIRYIWREKKELDGDSYRALQYMADVVIADKTDEDKFLLLAGDIFEQSRIDGQTLNEFTKFLDQLAGADVVVFFVQGQHDRNYPPHAEVQGAIWLHEQLMTIDGRKIYGLDWHSRDELHEELKSIPECDILVMHQAFEHMIPYGMAADLSTQDIPKHVGNILVGDIHVECLADFRGGWCLSPGPLHPCNVSQGGLKHIWKLSRNASADPEPILIPSRTIVRVSMNDEDLRGTIGSALMNSLEPIVELTYTMEQQEAAQRLMHQYRGKVVFFPKPTTGGRLLEMSEEDEEAPVLVEMPQVINEVVTRKKEPEFNMFLQDLWDGNPVEVIERKIKSCEEDDDGIDTSDFD